MRRFLLAILILIAFATTADAQRRRDALSEAETDQIREVADQPNKKIEAYLKFIRARLLAVEQLQGDPRLAKGRGEQLADLLEDIGNLVDELDVNLDMFAGRKDDIRKGLQKNIEASAEFGLKMRSIKAASEQADAAETRQYQFSLDNAIESVQSNAENARKLLEEVNAEIEAKKAEEKARRKKQ